MAIATKTKLRSDFLEKRNQLEPAIRKRDSAIIRQRLLGQRLWQDAHTVLVYVSYGSEVDTHPLLSEALKQRKRLIVPTTSPNGDETWLSEVHRLTDLSPGYFKNVLEPGPTFRKRVDPSEVELALIPGLAFDRQGGRLGQGGGYFDRLLPKMTHAICWGLAYSVQLYPDALPMESHDVHMHAIATETEIIQVVKG